jgi:hypothetical protein
MIDWFQTFKQFKPFNPTSVLPRDAGEDEGEGLEPSVAFERLERLERFELEPLGEYHG